MTPIREEKGKALLAQPSALLGEIRNRAALVAKKRPHGVSGPPLRYFLREIEAFAEPLFRKKGALEILPTAEPKVVMLLPGFGTHPVRMRRMARKLEEAGHTVKRWGMGFNLGPTPRNFELLGRRLEQIHRRYGQKVWLVGWSLGGVFAREIAKQNPELVAKVVTMGSPFSGDGHPISWPSGRASGRSTLPMLWPRCRLALPVSAPVTWCISAGVTGMCVSVTAMPPNTRRCGAAMTIW